MSVWVKPANNTFNGRFETSTTSAGTSGGDPKAGTCATTSAGIAGPLYIELDGTDKPSFALAATMITICAVDASCVFTFQAVENKTEWCITDDQTSVRRVKP